MTIDIFNVIAVLIGVWNTVRKLNVAKVNRDDYPRVAEGDFNRWKQRELKAYNLAIWACFLKVVVDVGWQIYGFKGGFAQSQPEVFAIVGFVLFAAWFVAIIASTLIGTSGRAMRGELGIVVGGRKPSAPAEDEE